MLFSLFASIMCCMCICLCVCTDEMIFSMEEAAQPEGAAGPSSGDGGTEGTNAGVIHYILLSGLLEWGGAVIATLINLQEHPANQIS